MTPSLRLALVDPLDQVARTFRELRRISPEDAIGAAEHDLVETDDRAAKHVEGRPGEVAGALGDDLGDAGPVDDRLDVDPRHQGIDVDPVHESIGVDTLEEAVDVDPIEQGVDVDLVEQGVDVDVGEDEVGIDDLENSVTCSRGHPAKEALLGLWLRLAHGGTLAIR